jgi:hypothetical protein
MRLLLDEHCIETAARRERERVSAVLLAIEEGSARFEELAERLELLDDFITTTDFGALRSSRPELDGRARVAVALERDSRGRVVCATLRSQ